MITRLLAFTLALLSFAVASARETEMVLVLSARVRDAIESRQEMPDTPPGIRLSGQVASSQMAKYRIAIIEASWCGACGPYKKMVKETPEVAVEKIYDFEDKAALAECEKEYGRIPDLALPATLFRKSNGTAMYFTGSVSREDLLSILKKNDVSQTGIVAQKSGSAGSISGVGGSIRSSMDWWASHVGGPVEITWDSNRNNGKGSEDGFAILHAKSSDWTCDRVLGTLGSITVKCPSGISIGREKFEEFTISYRSDGDSLVVTTAFAITKSTIELKGTSSSTPVKFIDPSTALTIFGIIRGLWEIAHPEVDLQLPGRISASVTLKDDSFLIDFTDPPRVRIKAYWEWMIGIDWVTISDNVAHFEMEPQPRSLFPILSREFAITD